MRALVKLAFLALVFAGCCAAVFLQTRQHSSSEDPTHRQLYTVILTQVKAMRADDRDPAWLRVSRERQNPVPSGNFRDASQASYPVVTRATGLQFGPARFRDNRATIEVYFSGHEGRVWPCVYRLVRERDVWKIDSVQVLPPWPDGSAFSGIPV